MFTKYLVIIASCLTSHLTSASCLHGTSLLPRAETPGGGVEVSKFGYTGLKGPLNWAALAPENSACATAKGQSPINLDDTIKLATEAPKVVIPSVEAAEFENLGTAVEVIINGTTTVAGKDFMLQQLHFHTPSEHRIAEEYFPLEMHMVHEATDGQLAVISVLFQMSEKNTALLSNITTNLDQIKTPGTITETSALDFSELTNHIMTTPLFQYTGSLTTPPCAGGLMFYVTQQPLALDVATYNALKSVVKFNSRYTQNALGKKNLLEVTAVQQGCVLANEGNAKAGVMPPAEGEAEATPPMGAYQPVESPGAVKATPPAEDAHVGAPAAEEKAMPPMETPAKVFYPVGAPGEAPAAAVEEAAKPAEEAAYPPPPVADAVHPGAPAAEAEAPKEEAAAEAPAAEAPKAEAPNAEAPKAEAPAAEAPKAEAPAAEAPAAEAPKAEAPKAEDAAAAAVAAGGAAGPPNHAVEVVEGPPNHAVEVAEGPSNHAVEVAEGPSNHAVEVVEGPPNHAIVDMADPVPAPEAAAAPAHPMPPAAAEAPKEEAPPVAAHPMPMETPAPEAAAAAEAPAHPMPMGTPAAAEAVKEAYPMPMETPAAAAAEAPKEAAPAAAHPMPMEPPAAAEALKETPPVAHPVAAAPAPEAAAKHPMA